MQHFHKKNLDAQREQSRRIQEEHQLREERFKAKRKREAKKKKKIIAISIAVLLLLGSLITYSWLSPGKYDNFAKCLTEKGAVMYGEDWCQYTQGQKNMFGKSFKYINYKVKKDLRKRPTWIIDGKKHETVQSFQRLSALTGCEI